MLESAVRSQIYGIKDKLNNWDLDEWTIRDLKIELRNAEELLSDLESTPHCPV